MIELTEERIDASAEEYAGLPTESLVARLQSIRLRCAVNGIQPALTPTVGIEIMGILKVISRNSEIVDFGDELARWLGEFIKQRKGVMHSSGSPVSIWGD